MENHEDLISNLRSIYPTFDEALIECVLREENGSLENTIDRLSTLLETESVTETYNANVASKIDRPIDFLMTCFPELRRAQLEVILADCHGSLSQAIDVASNYQTIHEMVQEQSDELYETEHTGKTDGPAINETFIMSNYADLCASFKHLTSTAVMAVFESSCFNVAVARETLATLQGDELKSNPLKQSADDQDLWYIASPKAKKKSRKLPGGPSTGPKTLDVRIKLPPRAAHVIDADTAAVMSKTLKQKDYAEHRASRALAIAERTKYFQRAAEAYAKGGAWRGAIAGYYASEGREAAQKVRQHQEMALDSLANRFKGMWTLDLHGLEVAEAIGFTERKLAEWRSKNMPGALILICGVGRHSDHGKARILPALTKMLRVQGYRFSEADPGRLKVTGLL